MKHKIVFVLLSALLFSFFSFPISAYGEEAAEDISKSFSEIIPNEVKEEIEYIYGDFEVNTDSAYKYLNIGFLAKFIAGLLENGFVTALKDFTYLLATVIFVSIIKKMSEIGTSGGITLAFEYFTALVVCNASANIIIGLWNEISDSLSSLNLFMNTLLPISASLYSLGGAATTAIMNSAFLSLAFTLTENIVSLGLFPILKISFGTFMLSFAAGNKALDLRGISSFIRHTFTVTVGLITVIFTFIMAYQNQLSLAADSAGTRTIKFAVQNMIPVVGSTVGEAMRAVIGGIGTLKSAVGVIGVAVILIMLLPVIVKLLVYRLILHILSLISQIIGLDREKSLFDELYSLLGYGLALITFCSMLFIFNLTMMIKSSTAVSI